MNLSIKIDIIMYVKSVRPKMWEGDRGFAQNLAVTSRKGRVSRNQVSEHIQDDCVRHVPQGTCE